MVSCPAGSLTCDLGPGGLPERERGVMARAYHLDSVRFRYFRTEHLALIPAAATDGLWENMVTQVAVWRGLNVTGISARELNPE